MNQPLINWHDFVSSVLYSVMGVVVFSFIFIVLDKLTPFHLWKELIEKQNTALAIVVGAVGLGICYIIAAAIHG
jgi:uncharacterized membrane protein YjfL (UPF0719 family)